MILGIGTDIIEIERIAIAIERHGMRFLDHVFTKKEQQYALKFQENKATFAGRFAAKEAVAKALGTGISEHLHWTDIEIVNNEQGKPEVHLSEKARLHFQNPEILISISHCKAYAHAVALWQDRKQEGK